MIVRTLLVVVSLGLAAGARAGRAQPEGGLAPLVAQLDAPDDRAQWHAAYALGQRGAEADAALPALLARVSDPQEYEYVRGAAAWAVGRIAASPAQAVPVLTDVLASSHISLRRNATRALGQYGESAQSAVPRLIERLEDTDSTTRVNAAVALWRIERNPTALAALRRALASDSAAEAFEAATALGGLKEWPAEAVEWLVAALGHADADVRRAAGDALRQWGAVAVPRLCTLARDGKGDARRQAVEILAALGGDDAVTCLTTILVDLSAQSTTRRAAARGLGAIGPQAAAARPALLRAVNDQDPGVRREAAAALARIE